MKVNITKKALEQLYKENAKEITISVKTSGGWTPSGNPFLVMGSPEGLDGTFEEKQFNDIKVHVKTCIKSPNSEIELNYGGLFKKVFYITGALSL